MLDFTASNTLAAYLDLSVLVTHEPQISVVLISYQIASLIQSTSARGLFWTLSCSQDGLTIRTVAVRSD
jgi:hypothetical protein